MGKDIKKSSKPAKWVALATYAIALLCLLAGLLVPLAPVSLSPLKEAFTADNMLIMQAFAALGTFGLKIPFAPDTFVYSYAKDVKLFGAIPAFDLGAVLVLLYVLVCVIALIGLIPVIASNRYKRTALRTASFVEGLGVIAAGLMVLVQLGQFAVGANYWNNWAFAPVIALGGCVLMLIIQSFAYKKGSGVIKFVLMLLSVVAVFSALFANVAKAQLDTVVGKLPAVIGDYSLYNNGEAVFGASLISALFTGAFDAVFTGAVLEKVLAGVALALSLLVVINAVLDVLGLGKTTKLYMLVINIVRYVLELIAVILFVVFTFVIKDVTLGFFGYVLAIVALLQFIINLIRLLVFIPKKKKAAKTAGKTNTVAVAETSDGGAEEATEEKVDKKAAKRAAKEAKKAEKEAKKNAAQVVETETEETETAAAEATPIIQKNTDPSVYVVEPTYNGPVDEFIKTLTNAERIEFAYCFIEKNLILPNVPEYIVGGNNKKFFASVFIYWARLSSRVSDGLMNKLYEQGNIMN